jgi:hypothetical protein
MKHVKLRCWTLTFDPSDFNPEALDRFITYLCQIVQQCADTSTRPWKHSLVVSRSSSDVCPALPAELEEIFKLAARAHSRSIFALLVARRVQIWSATKFSHKNLIESPKSLRRIEPILYRALSLHRPHFSDESIRRSRQPSILPQKCAACVHGRPRSFSGHPAPVTSRRST